MRGRDGSTLLTRAVVDSGASCSCFPLAFADRLGIDLSECETRTGGTAAGAAEQYVWPDGLPAIVAGVEVQLDCVFTATRVALLGRRDVFSLFRVCFDEQGQVFSLTGALENSRSE